LWAFKFESFLRLMAKSHKAQEQATSLRKRNDELEAVQLQLQSEKKSLQSRAKELEEALEKLKSQMEEVKVQAEEAATLAASNKVVVETESLKRLETSLEEKTTEISQVKEELMALKTASAKQQEELHEAEGRYQQLLKNTAMQSDGKSSMASTRPRRSSTGQRNVFIQLAGAQYTGKTSLLEALIQEYEPSALQKFNEQKSNFMAHHQLQ
ncbi:unnamed protein product, partial [Durusdinium trenchii]